MSINQSINQSINENLYSAPSRSLLRGARDPGQVEKNSLEKVHGGIENRYCLGRALDLLEVHSKLLDQPQKKNGSALWQGGRMGPPNYHEQRTAGYVYDGMHKKRAFVVSVRCTGHRANLTEATITRSTDNAYMND